MSLNNSNGKKTKFGISAEIIIMIIICILIFSAVISFNSKRIFSNIMKKQIETLIEDTCNIARDCVNGDYFDNYLESKGQSEESLLALRLLQKVCDDTKFNYLYIIRPDFENDKVINSLSVSCKLYNLKVYEVGVITKITAEDYRQIYHQIMDGEKETDFVYRLDMPRSYKTQHHVTGLSAIHDSKGNVVGIMCAEATFSWYREALNLYMKNFLTWLAFMLIIVIVACNIMIRYRIIRPFLKIKKETERFAAYNTVEENKLESLVNRRNELGILAHSIDQMESQTLQYVENITKMTAEKEKSATQLKIATEIQLGALPKPIKFDQIDLFATMKPAQEVGGDFYDFFNIDEKHVAIVIADVSGKGVPAALFMMISKILLSKNLKAGMSPAEALSKTNTELCEENPAEMFVTCFCGVLDLETKLLTFANAGHEKPAICKKHEKFVFAQTKAGFVLGGMPGIKYKDEQLQLESEDIFFCYTDGIPEAMNPESQPFGDERLIEVLNCSKDKPLEELCNDMNNAIVKFNDTAPQFDDITMLCFKINS